MGQHTPEPWILDGNCVAAESDQLNKGYYTAIGRGPDRDGNARRIVACVNACRGLPTEELEQKGIVAAVGTQLLAADDRAEGQEREIRRLAGIASDAQNQLSDALNQRDELLTAIESLLADMRLRAQLRGDLDSDGCVILDCGSGVLMKVDAAITKVKGGAA